MYIGLGTNIEPERNLVRALELLRQSVDILAVSSVWETPPVGSDGPHYLNMAVLVRTHLTPEVVKDKIIHDIETRLGRVRSADKNSPRTIDLDILIADGNLMEPMLWERFYEAVPLAELIPDYTNPASGESLAGAAARLSRGLALRRREANFLS